VSISTAAPQGEYPVQLEIERPQRSSRLLVIFRGFLAFPHFFFALPVVLVAVVLLWLNYLAVLFTRRSAFAGFLSGTLRYLTRFNAYMNLLTDKYPPFSLGDSAEYPARVIVEPPGSIPRWRVFSGLLLFPHSIVLLVLGLLVAISTLISAVVILVTGRYPAGLFGFSAGVLRWQTRVNAYAYLIADRYPPFSLS
jgi:hypothetical protein